MNATTSSRVMAALLSVAGVMHFVQPRFFDGIVPRVLPGPPRTWTHASGVAELAVAAAVAGPRTRRQGALAAAVLYIAVFPANIQAALDARTVAERAVTWIRLPLQVPLVLWALRIRRSS